MTILVFFAQQQCGVFIVVLELKIITVAVHGDSSMRTIFPTFFVQVSMLSFLLVWFFCVMWFDILNGIKKGCGDFIVVLLVCFECVEYFVSLWCIIELCDGGRVVVWLSGLIEDEAWMCVCVFCYWFYDLDSFLNSFFFTWSSGGLSPLSLIVAVFLGATEML